MSVLNSTTVPVIVAETVTVTDSAISRVTLLASLTHHIFSDCHNANNIKAALIKVHRTALSTPMEFYNPSLMTKQTLDVS